MLNVTTHPEHTYWKPVWTLINDFTLGEKQVKSKGDLYLPTSQHWTPEQYREYLELAPFTNFSSRTVNALLGAMFMKSPMIDLPESIQYLLNNADGRNNGLQQIIRRLAHEAVKLGRAGIFVDYPRVDVEEGARTITAEQSSNTKATMITYDAPAILDWEEDELGLTYILLEEPYRTRELSTAGLYMMKLRHRELALEDNRYIVRIYEQGAKVDEFVPEVDGKPLDYIPFFMVGAVNNDAECDTPPIYEIVSKNKTHYILEAEIMKNIRLMNSPFLVMSIGNLSPDKFMKANGLDNGEPLTFGVSRGLILGSGGKAEVLQAQANDMVQTKAKDVLQEAVMLGARLVTKGGSGRATAEQIRIETSAENAVINSISKNVEAAVLKALDTVQAFMSQTIELCVVSMNTEFYAQQADAQILMFAKDMMANSAGVFSPRDMFTLLKNSGLIDSNRTFEQVMNDSSDFLTQNPETE